MERNNKLIDRLAQLNAELELFERDYTNGLLSEEGVTVVRTNRKGVQFYYDNDRKVLSVILGEK